MSFTRQVRRLLPAISRQHTTQVAKPATTNLKTKLVLGAAATVASGLYFLSNKTPAIKPNNAYIVSVGSLLDLDYKATIVAFMKLAITKGEILTITPDTIQKVLVVDSSFKTGKKTEQEFRAEVCAILGIEASAEQFDVCWNAMLGDTSKLKQKIQAISDLHPNTLFISATNPIHARALGINKSNFFLSYQNGCEEIACLQQAIQKFNLNPETTTLVLRQDNQNVAPITDKNQVLRHAVEEWATSSKLKLCKCAKPVEVFIAIQKCLVAPDHSPPAYYIQKH